MPRNEGTLQSPTRENLQPAKPEPPADLWDQVDAALNEYAAARNAVERPPKSFTAAEHSERFGGDANSSYRELSKMARLGKVKKIKTATGSVYWQSS